MAETDRVKLRHSLLNESRVNIITRLLSKPTNISDLDKNLPIDRSTICYHLNILEDVGILESKYVILEAPHSKGRAGRVYSINSERLTAAIESIQSLSKKLTG